jgi:hypothetical protein
MRRALAVIAMLTLTGAMAALAPASSASPSGTFTGAVSNIAGVSIEAILKADHPQSGDGWEFLECSSPTGTCSYPQTGTARIELSSSLLPQHCAQYVFVPYYHCGQWVDEWEFSWYDPEGSEASSSCMQFWDSGTGLPAGSWCSMSISGRLPGEYRGELCRTVYPSHNCVETLLEVYFNVTSPAVLVEAEFQSLAPYDGWVLEQDETSGKGGTFDAAAATGRLGDDALDRQYRAILDFDTSALPDDAVIVGITIRIKRQAITGTNPFSILGLLTVDMKTGYFHDNPALEKLDFHAMGSRGNVGRFIKTPAEGWYRAPLRAPSYLLVNLTGHTQFRLRFYTDDNDNGVADYLSFYTGDTPTLADRPELIITYYVP